MGFVRLNTFWSFTQHLKRLESISFKEMCMLFFVLFIVSQRCHHGWKDFVFINTKISLQRWPMTKWWPWQMRHWVWRLVLNNAFGWVLFWPQGNELAFVSSAGRPSLLFTCSYGSELCCDLFPGFPICSGGLFLLLFFSDLPVLFCGPTAQGVTKGARHKILTSIRKLHQRADALRGLYPVSLILEL